MDAIFSIIQVLIAIAMIAIILIQRGPGAAAGSGFGAGASGTVFGARGSGSFLTRATAVLAIGFFAVSMTMAVLASRAASNISGPDLGVMGTAVEDNAPPEVPALDVPQLDVPTLDVGASEQAPANDMIDVPDVEETAADTEGSEENGERGDTPQP
ncbi:MAG: preprotein translocase subunit SecG [Lysobacterales bacterium]